MPSTDSTAQAALRALWGALLDLVYPPHCIGCGRSLHEEDRPDKYFCFDCLRDLPFIGEARCPKCGHELAEFAAVHPRCPSCEGKPLHFKSATAPFRYEGIATEVILRFKLARQVAFADPLARYMIEHMESTGWMPRIDAIAAVPLHWRRLWKRGYNQSQLLADRVGQRFGVPLLHRPVSRVFSTPSQTRVSREKRRENLRGAFVIRHPRETAGKTILLIDDVLTTGATCAECSRALITEGHAKAVYVATVARTMFQH